MEEAAKASLLSKRTSKGPEELAVFNSFSENLFRELGLGRWNKEKFENSLFVLFSLLPVVVVEERQNFSVDSRKLSLFFKTSNPNPVARLGTLKPAEGNSKMNTIAREGWLPSL